MDPQDAALMSWQHSLRSCLAKYQSAGDELAGALLRGQVYCGSSCVKPRDMLTVLHVCEIDINAGQRVVKAAWDMAHEGAGCGKKRGEKHGIMCAHFDMAAAAAEAAKAAEGGDGR